MNTIIHQTFWRFGKWLMLVALLAAVGCQSIGGLDLNKAMLSGLDTVSMQGSATVSLHIELDPKQQPDESAKAMYELLNDAKLELQQMKMESAERMSVSGQLTLAKGAIPFRLAADPDRVVVKVDGAAETIVFPTGLNGKTKGRDTGGAGSDIARQISAKFKEKGVDKALASFIVNNLPNPKKIAVTSGTETIHNEQVSVYKLETTIGGNEMVPLVKTFLRNLTKDDEAFKKLIGQLYDVLWPVLEPYVKSGTWNGLPTATPAYGSNPFGHLAESVAEAASDKELAVDIIHTFMKQALFIAMIAIDSADKGEDSPLHAVLGDGTSLNAQLYFDRELALRKSVAELSIYPKLEHNDGVAGIRIAVQTENWDRNKPVKADVLEPGSQPFVIGEDGTFADWLDSADPNSLLGLLAQQERERTAFPTPTVLFLPIAEAGSADAHSAYLDDGTAYASLDFLAGHLGADVAYDGQTATVTTAWGSRMTLAVGSDEAVLDGESYEMGGTVRREGDIVFVPCRFVAEELGAFVSYDEQQQRIEIEFFD